MDKPIGWLRIFGNRIIFSQKEPIGKPGIHVPVKVFNEKEVRSAC